MSTPRAVEAASTLTLIAALFVVFSGPISATTGRVSLDDYALTDDQGVFLGLGATYFLALRQEKYEEAQLQDNLAFLSQQGFDYIRILSMIGSDPAWGGKEILPPGTTYEPSACNSSGPDLGPWPDYWQQFRQLVDRVYDVYGMRTQITIFADADCVMNQRHLRDSHVANLLTEVVAGREHKIILVEVANEYWQNGVGLLEIQQHGATLANATNVLVALTAPLGGKTQTDPTYRGTLADIATIHFSRAGGWTSVFDCEDIYECAGCLRDLPMRASNNEPVGPGSSVYSEEDLVRITMAPAVSWGSKIPMFVFHSRPGITADNRNISDPKPVNPKSFAELFQKLGLNGRFNFLKSLLPVDLANWVRSASNAAGNPFIKSAGIFRSPASLQGAQFISFVAGVPDSSQTLTATSYLVQVRICSPADQVCTNVGVVPQGGIIHPRSFYARDGFILTGRKDAAPAACFVMTGCNGLLECTFDATCSTDDAGIVTYRWDFGDNSPLVEGPGPILTHTYGARGTYPVTLTVVDTVGQQASVAQNVLVSPPVACFTLSCDGLLECTFDAACSTDDTGIVTYQWDFGDSSPVVEGPEPGTAHDYEARGTYPVTLTTIDSSGQAASLTQGAEAKDYVRALLVILSGQRRRQE